MSYSVDKRERLHERAIKSLASGKSGYKSPGNSIKHEVKNPL